MIKQIISVTLLSVVSCCAQLWSAPVLTDSSIGTLQLLTPPSQQLNLHLIDGLEFDSVGNLMGVLEIAGPSGGVVSINKNTGDVTSLVTNISRADQISLAPNGKMFVSSEVGIPSTTNRIYEVSIGYASGVPDPGTTTISSLTTSSSINNPEGLVVLSANSAYGNAGDMIVSEDIVDGRVLKVAADGTVVELAGNLFRPEGLTLGDFDGAAALGVYVAETRSHRVLHIESDGTTSVLGDPTSVGLVSPDNVRFGPDGFLYVTEDRADGKGRVVRVAADGTHSVFATGFENPQGMAFDPMTGDMFIAEHGLNQVWRVQFSSVPEPNAALCFLSSAWCSVRRD